MPTCIQQSVAEGDTSVMGLVKAPAFCINLAWQSLQMPYLSQQETLLVPEVPNSLRKDRKKPFSDRWYKKQVLFSVLFGPFPCHLLEAITCLTFLSRDVGSGCTFQTQCHVSAASFQLLVSWCSCPPLATHTVLLCLY